MQPTRYAIFIITLLTAGLCHAQKVTIDSTLQSLQTIPLQYISTIDNKIDKYSKRISSKTEKTLEKLTKWETKIHGLLLKASPEAAERLFGNNQNTFATLLQKIKEGKSIAEGYQAQYHEYRDKLTTNIKYLQSQQQNLDSKFIKPLTAASAKITALNKEADNAEAIQQFIKERKKQLIDGAFKTIGNSKYLTKINKESWYYLETMKNYKELFNDPKKAEETAKTILNKIPAFQKFMQQNSMLAGLFGQPGDVASAANLAGLQTRAGVSQLIQQRIAAGGPDAMQQVQQNIQAARSSSISCLILEACCKQTSKVL